MYEFLWVNRLYHGWIWYLRITRANLRRAYRPASTLRQGLCTSNSSPPDNCWCAIYFTNVLNIDIDLNVDDEDFASEFHEALNGNDEFSSLANMMDDILSEKIASDDLTLLHDYIIKVSGKLEHFKDNLNENKTAKLWLMILIISMYICKFTKAQRIGNWLLHLEAISERLPYFASSGHYLYAKSTYLYLQSMNELSATNPDVYNMFMNGHHVVRRSDAYWAGVSTDLAIEQELMGSIKKTGGLTRGRGMAELQRAKWLLSTPTCAEIKSAVHSLTGISFQTGEQHKALRSSRMERDYTNAMKILKFLIERNPFDDGAHLMNIETGEVSDDAVRDHRQIGSVIYNRFGC